MGWRRKREGRVKIKERRHGVKLKEVEGRKRKEEAGVEGRNEQWSKEGWRCEGAKRDGK